MSTTAASALRKLNLRQATEAALTNEQLTRERVDKLELHVRNIFAVLQAHQKTHAAADSRGFWGRLRWLLRGK